MEQGGFSVGKATLSSYNSESSSVVLYCACVSGVGDNFLQKIGQIFLLEMKSAFF